MRNSGADQAAIAVLQIAGTAPGNGTHYAFWSVPGSGVWTPRQVPGTYDPLIPLIL